MYRTEGTCTNETILKYLRFDPISCPNDEDFPSSTQQIIIKFTDD